MEHWKVRSAFSSPSIISENSTPLSGWDDSFLHVFFDYRNLSFSLDIMCDAILGFKGLRQDDCRMTHSLVPVSIRN